MKTSSCNALRAVALIFLSTAGNQPGTAEEAGANDVLATYRGGSVTRGELDAWNEAIGVGRTSPLLSRQVKSFAIAEYLSAEAEKKDLVLEMQKQAAEAAAVRGYYTAKLNQSMVPTPEQIESAFQERKDSFSRPGNHRLRSIFKSKEGKTEDEVGAIRKKMEEIHARLEAGEEFATLAVAESESVTRFDGGMVGNITKGSIRPEFEEVIFSLKEGEFSAVQEDEKGFHLFYCQKVNPPRELPEEEMRRRVETHLQRTAYRETWEKKQKDWVEAATLDLEKLQTRTDGDAVLTLGSGETYSKAEVLAVLQGTRMPVAPPGGMTAEVVRNILTKFIVDTCAAEEYLASNPFPEELRTKLEWKGVHLASDREFGRRLASLGPAEEPTEAELRKLFDETPLSSKFAYRIETLTTRIASESFVNDFEELQQFRDSLVEDENVSMLQASQVLSRDLLDRSSIQGARWLEELQVRAGLGGPAYKALSDLEIGETSPVFRSTTMPPAFWIVRLLETREGRPLTYEESKPGLEQYLRKKRAQERQNRVETEILEEMEYQFLEDK